MPDHVASFWEGEDKNILRWIISYNELRVWVHIMVLVITNNQFIHKVHAITLD